MTLGVALVLAAAVSSCADVELLAPAPDRLVVHAIIDAGANEVVVLVEWTPGRARPENGAVVSVTPPGGAPLIVPRHLSADTIPGYGPLWPGYYRLTFPGAGVIPGGTYGLKVIVGPTSASGTTTVPAIAAVPFWTQDTLRVSKDTVSLTWGNVAGAKSYVVTVSNHFTSGTFNFGSGVDYSAFVSSPSITIPGSAHNVFDEPIFGTGGKAVLIVSAVDANYYDYYRRITDPLAGAQASKLTGALGVFGSVVPLHRKEYFVVP